MATITITLTGSAIVPNSSKAYTISDTDLQSLLSWAAVTFNQYIQTTFNPTNLPTFVPTSQQILLAWVQSWVDVAKIGVQRFITPPPVVPPPINIG